MIVILKKKQYICFNNQYYESRSQKNRIPKTKSGFIQG
jgi:hypothetical protein